MSGLLHKAKDKLVGHGDLTSGTGNQQSTTQSSMGKGFNTVGEVEDDGGSGDLQKDLQNAVAAQREVPNGVDGVVRGEGEMAGGVKNIGLGDAGARSGGI